VFFDIDAESMFHAIEHVGREYATYPTAIYGEDSECLVSHCQVPSLVLPSTLRSSVFASSRAFAAVVHQPAVSAREFPAWQHRELQKFFAVPRLEGVESAVWQTHSSADFLYGLLMHWY